MMMIDDIKPVLSRYAMAYCIGSRFTLCWTPFFSGWASFRYKICGFNVTLLDILCAIWQQNFVRLNSLNTQLMHDDTKTH